MYPFVYSPRFAARFHLTTHLQIMRIFRHFVKRQRHFSFSVQLKC
jgi:hypothetical protein